MTRIITNKEKKDEIESKTIIIKVVSFRKKYYQRLFG